MTVRLLLDEHYSPEIAESLCGRGHDVTAVADSIELRSKSDASLFQVAAAQDFRIVTENIKDFRPLLMKAYTSGEPVAPLLLVSPRRFPRGTGDRTHTIVKALAAWLNQAKLVHPPDEDWLS